MDDMKTPEKILNTGKTLIWFEKNDKELFEAHIDACTDPGTYEDYTQWKYDCLERTEQAMQTTLSLGQFVPCKDGKVLEEPILESGNVLSSSTDTATRKFWKQKIYRYGQACKEIWFDGWRDNAWGCSNDKTDKHIHFDDKKGIDLITYYIVPESLVYKKHKRDIRQNLGFATLEDLIREVDLIGTDVYWNLIFK